MFYLTKRQDGEQCNVGDRCMVLSDFSGIAAGTKGTVIEIYGGEIASIYGKGVMIEWDVKKCTHPSPCACPGSEPNHWGKPLADGFAADELEYLAFETKSHPKIDPEVNRTCPDCLGTGEVSAQAPVWQGEAPTADIGTRPCHCQGRGA